MYINAISNLKFIDIAYIRSSLQVALLGHITPNHRTVSVECRENELKTPLYYDNSSSEDEKIVFIREFLAKNLRLALHPKR